MSEEIILGRCIGEATPTTVVFVSKKMPRVGEYVILEYDGKKVLGMVETLIRGSVSITDEIYDPKTVEKIKSIEGDDHYIKGTVRIIGDIESLKIPRTPPSPGTEVKKADDSVLKNVFGDTGQGLRLGTLITHKDVPVFIDVNKMVTRHLAILAMTGAGKSNTVAVITDGLLKHNGSVVIFDMHSEYINADFRNGKVKPIRTKINPLYLSFSELAKLAHITGEHSHVQERYFRMAYTSVKEMLQNGEIQTSDFFESIKIKLDEYLESDEYKGDKKSIIAIKNKLDDLIEYYGSILDLNCPEIADEIKLGFVNVIDLGTVDEDAADVIVSHVMRKLLTKRKNYIRSKDGLNFPVFVILEEAHILAPKSRSTFSKYWISRVAREGRKFGVGLCLVSQSPKSLDPDSLSQANNMIILRLVEPTDQRHVQMASESLSEDLLAQLPSLNIAEAVVVGLMTKVPALVKIDEFQGKLVGGDLDIINEWKNVQIEDKRNSEVQRKDIEDIEEGY